MGKMLGLSPGIRISISSKSGHVHLCCWHLLWWDEYTVMWCVICTAALHVPQVHVVTRTAADRLCSLPSLPRRHRLRPNGFCHLKGICFSLNRTYIEQCYDAPHVAACSLWDFIACD